VTDPLDLRAFDARLDEILAGPPDEARDLLLAEHRQWHDLHDRLVSIIAACIDDAVDRGEALDALLGRVRDRTGVGVDSLVGTVPSAGSVAALLRAHHSTGAAAADGATVTFTHQCGSGLAHWRRSPGVALVAAGEVVGVPGGVPRYCARCISTIDAVGDGRWRVRPPSGPDGPPCRWELDDPG
jgi:hypothetical protein